MPKKGYKQTPEHSRKSGMSRRGLRRPGVKRNRFTKLKRADKPLLEQPINSVLESLVQLVVHAVRDAYALGSAAKKSPGASKSLRTQTSDPHRPVGKLRACEILEIAPATLDRIRLVGGKYYDPEFPPGSRRSGRGGKIKWRESDLFAYRDKILLRTP